MKKLLGLMGAIALVAMQGLAVAAVPLKSFDTNFKSGALEKMKIDVGKVELGGALAEAKDIGAGMQTTNLAFDTRQRAAAEMFKSDQTAKIDTKANRYVLAENGTEGHVASHPSVPGIGYGGPVLRATVESLNVTISGLGIIVPTGNG